MASNFTPSKVFTGAGKAWLDGDLLFEAKALQASVEIQMEAVPQGGQLADGQRMIGFSGSGTLRMHKVSSRMKRLMSDALKRGENPSFEIVSELTNTATGKAERETLKEVQFTTLALVNWELKTLLEEEFPFVFRDWTLNDTVSEE